MGITRIFWRFAILALEDFQKSMVFFQWVFVDGLCVCSPFVCCSIIACVSTFSHFLALMSSCVTRFLLCPFLACPEV